MEDIKTKAKISYDRALARKNLNQSISARMLLAHAGGLWRCDPLLIALLESYKDHSEIVIADSQDIPHKVDPSLLLGLVKQRHQEVMNDWFVAYAALAKIRSADNV